MPLGFVVKNGSNTLELLGAGGGFGQARAIGLLRRGFPASALSMRQAIANTGAIVVHVGHRI
jgi:hypothetical protein